MKSSRSARRKLLAFSPWLIALLACESGSSTDPPTPPSATGGAAAGSPAASGTSGNSATPGGSTSGGATSTGGKASAGTATSGQSGEAGRKSEGGASGSGLGPPAPGNTGGGGGTASGGAPEAGSAGSPPKSPEWKEEFPTFAMHEVAEFTDGYYTSAFDVDGDGKTDVAALSASRSQLVWFKNPDWQKYTITSGTQRFIAMAPYDADDDGHTDLAIASEFDMTNTRDGGTVYWVEAPDDPTQTWTLHEVDAVPTSHRVRWGDLDGDGRKELLNLPLFGRGSSSPEYVGPVALNAYAVPAAPSDAWTASVVNDSLLEVAHGFTVVDWDGDQNEDVLTASNAGVHLFQPGILAEPRQLGVGAQGERPERGSSEVGLGSLGGPRFIATIEPWHGTDAVVYTPGTPDTGQWTRTLIGNEFQRGHALAVADFNADGFDEIVGGDQNGGGALMIFRYVPSSDSWQKIDVNRGDVAVIGIDIADVNGDGALDIVAIGGASNNVVWFENSL